MLAKPTLAQLAFRFDRTDSELVASSSAFDEYFWVLDQDLVGPYTQTASVTSSVHESDADVDVDVVASGSVSLAPSGQSLAALSGGNATYHTRVDGEALDDLTNAQHRTFGFAEWEFGSDIYQQGQGMPVVEGAICGRGNHCHLAAQR